MCPIVIFGAKKNYFFEMLLNDNFGNNFHDFSIYFLTIFEAQDGNIYTLHFIPKASLTHSFWSHR